MLSSKPFRITINPRLWPAVACAVLFAAFGARPLQAHDPFQSWATAHVASDGVRIEITLSPYNAEMMLENGASLPPITPENFTTFQTRLKGLGGKLYEITAGGVVLPVRTTEVTLTEESDINFRMEFPAIGSGPARFRAVFLDQMTDEYISTLFVEDANGKSLGWDELNKERPNLDVIIPADGETAKPPSSGSLFMKFLQMGVRHILTGYDHLLFLCGLLVACRRFRTMAVIITCFTLAHSITLGLAALDVIVLSPRIVEPMIAASIVFVGVENLVRRDEPKGRWLLTFGFGLIHGFGFAGALKEVGLGSGGLSLLVPLFSFNLGVEAGQLSVVAVVLPLLLKLRKFPAFTRYGVPAISVVVVILGGYWLLQRTVFS